MTLVREFLVCNIMIYLGYLTENMRCRRHIHILVGAFVCDLNLTFVLGIVTLTSKILSRLYLEKVRYRKLILCSLGMQCRVFLI